MKIFLVLFGLAAAVSAQTIPPATYKSGADLMSIIREKSKAAPNDQTSAPVGKGDGYQVNVVHRNTPGTAMAHLTGPAKGSEVHYIIEGEAIVVTGGTLMRPAGAAPGRGGPPSTIDNGVTHHVVKGDVLVIPAGTPHWYKEIISPVTYLETRFDVDKSEVKTDKK